MMLIFALLIFPTTNTNSLMNNETDKQTKNTKYFGSFNITNVGNQQKDKASDERRTFQNNKPYESDLDSSFEMGYRGYRRVVARSDLYKHVQSSNTDQLGETSTSLETKGWQSSWSYNWQKLKINAIQSPVVNMSRGHRVNMAAARPWRVPCGDVNNQDVPWGSCTLPYECDAELRIFRGDVQCRTLSQFVCCAAQKADYDMYQALDASFIDSSSVSTSSLERLRKVRGSRENKKRKDHRIYYRMKKNKYRRKRKIKKTIRKLERVIRRELNRAFRNSSELRQQTTNKLKRFIQSMKDKVRQDRYTAKKLHDKELKRIDGVLQAKLDKVRDLNHNFLINDTFHEMVFSGNMTELAMRTILKAHPELHADVIGLEPNSSLRRSGGGVIPTRKRHKKRKYYRDYDIEIGILDF